MRSERTSEVGPKEFIALMACIMLLTALAIDIMLPAFNDLRTYFGLGPDSTATAHIVTFFFIGQIGQIFCGPLSDRYGRIPIMRAGFLLYIIACIAAAFSPTLNGILVARFFVGLGSAAMSVSCTAAVRDRFEGSQMARTMSLILTIFLSVPIIAPILGTAILNATSWQVVFLTPPVFAVIIFMWSLRLRESLPQENRQALNVPAIMHSARRVVGNRVFIRYAAVTTILFSAFSSYISSSERMIGEIYGRHDLFVPIFASIGAVMAAFTFINAQLIERFGSRRTVQGWITLYVILAVALFGLTLVLRADPPIFVFFGAVALLQGINVAAEPNSGALALEPLGSIAGMAAAIYGTMFLVVGATIGSFIDRLLVNSVAPLAVAYFIAGLAAATLVYTDRKAAVPAAETPRALPEAGD
jgi:DHA1 family bicyclomycin/chloramphenicol resistance-like MFS transporter